MQFTHPMKPQQLGPMFKPTNTGLSKDNPGIKLGDGAQGHGDPAGGLRDKLQNGNLDGKNVGKIVTLPATTVGKAGSNQDLKANGFPNRIVRRDTSAIKLNTNPSQGGRPQGNSLTGKIGGGNANCALRRTSSLVGYQRQYFQVGRSNGPGV
jgi:hypothetical protein